MGVASLPVIGPIASLFRRTPESFVWKPRRIGPKFEWLDHERIRLLDGALAGEVFDLRTEILEMKANALLDYNGRPVGRAYVERDPPGKGIVLWDIAVNDEYRSKGLASIMAYAVFRELLFVQETAFFKIRMIRLMKAVDRNIELQNVGIGVIANRLGFVPEFDIEKIMRPDNITDIEIVPAKGDLPPGFKVVIKTFPLVLIAFVLDQDTLKPLNDFDTYVKVSKDERMISDWARRGLIVLGNGNYWLTNDNVTRFVNHIAVDEHEAHVFRRRVRGAEQFQPLGRRMREAFRTRRRPMLEPAPDSAL